MLLLLLLLDGAWCTILFLTRSGAALWEARSSRDYLDITNVAGRH